MPDPSELSGAGDPIFRYDEPPDDEGFSAGDPELIDAVSAHLERHLGPMDHVFHEVVSTTVHVDVHWVPPAPKRPWHTLVTSGMAERPMNVPPEMAEWAFAELMVSLPADWPIDVEAFKEEDVYWPIRVLKSLARFPHEYHTWLGYGHTVPNGDPPAPFAPSTRLSSVMLMPPLLCPEGFSELVVSPERTVHFWSLVPLHQDELDLKLRRGSDALLARLDRAGVTEVIDPDRASVAAARKWWPFGRRFRPSPGA